jgi:hypothetical protein
MMLLTVSIVIFIIVIALIIYGNMPPSASGVSCGRCGGGGCPNCPCNNCGEPAKQCQCGGGAQAGGCAFC